MTPRHSACVGAVLLLVAACGAPVARADQKKAELRVTATVVRSCSVDSVPAASRLEAIVPGSRLVSCVRGTFPEPRVTLAETAAPSSVPGEVDPSGTRPGQAASATPSRLLTINF